MQMNFDIMRKNTEYTRKARILGTDVPCKEKRELIVPLEMRYRQSVGYCEQVCVA